MFSDVENVENNNGLTLQLGRFSQGEYNTLGSREV